MSYDKLLTKYSTGPSLCRHNSNCIKHVPLICSKSRYILKISMICSVKHKYEHYTKMNGTISCITVRCGTSEGFFHVMIIGFLVFNRGGPPVKRRDRQPGDQGDGTRRRRDMLPGRPT